MLYFCRKASYPLLFIACLRFISKNMRDLLIHDWRDVFCSILSFNKKREIVIFGREKVGNDIDFAYILKNISQIYISNILCNQK
jgi:hypothetical protein